MLAWWESLSVISQIFACVAIPTSLVLLIQTVLMLIGIGADALDGVDADLDLDGDGVLDQEFLDTDPDPSGLDGLRIFTVRGIIAFAVVFGWVGLVMDTAGVALWLTIAIATASGVAMMVLLAAMMRAVMKLRSDGTLDNRNALGVSGRVYLTVPASRTGEGKVNVLLQGSYVERDAVTDEAADIPTGCEVVVTGLSGQTTLVVKRK